MPGYRIQAYTPQRGKRGRAFGGRTLLYIRHFIIAKVHKLLRFFYSKKTVKGIANFSGPLLDRSYPHWIND